MMHYKLNEHGEPELVSSFEEWLAWNARTLRTDPARVVAVTAIESTGSTTVSTGFHGYDLLGRDPPLLWETLVIGGPLDGVKRAYASRGDAQRGHEDIVRRLNQLDSTQLFVRSQDQLSLYTPRATGRVMTVREVLECFGTATLFEVLGDGAALLAHDPAEPGRTLRERREQLGLTTVEVAHAAWVLASHVHGAEQSARIPFRYLERIAIVLGLDEMRLSFRPGVLRERPRFLVDEASHVIEVDDLATWVHQLGDVDEDKRLIESTTFADAGTITSLFLGYGEDRRDPRPWGTIFEPLESSTPLGRLLGDPFCDRQWRYASRDDAKRGHQEIIERVRAVHRKARP